MKKKTYSRPELKAFYDGLEEGKKQIAETKAKVEKLEAGLKAFLEAPQYKAFNEQILYKEVTPIKQVRALDVI